MKLPRRGMTQYPNEELRWFYQDSAADVGMSAMGLEPSPIITPGPSTPSELQQLAARRQSRIMRALADLEVQQRGILQACYLPRAGLGDLGHSAGNGAVWRAYEESAELKELQRRLDKAKPKQKQLHRERLAAARNQVARDTMALVKQAHRDYVAARAARKQAERAAEKRTPPAMKHRMVRTMEQPGRRRQRRATDAEVIASLGPDDREMVLAIFAELAAERQGA